ncbi:hypothetical protein AB0M20_45255, partial [Actinoplanes sp. NPDC051633]|uniref:hypothetical protein n=1 Tax=Actinoplanes sp. NPDC051633 TaxID=3155670 RepID=UPI003422DBA5
PGIWYGITAGGLAGYQVRENPPNCYEIGAHTGLSYLVQRPATVRSAAPKAYIVDRNGTVTSVTTTYRAGDRVTVNYREVLNGGQYARLADGPYTGRWLPLAAVAFS